MSRSNCLRSDALKAFLPVGLSLGKVLPRGIRAEEQRNTSHTPCVTSSCSFSYPKVCSLAFNTVLHQLLVCSQWVTPESEASQHPNQTSQVSAAQHPLTPRIFKILHGPFHPAREHLWLASGDIHFMRQRVGTAVDFTTRQRHKDFDAAKLCTHALNSSSGMLILKVACWVLSVECRSQRKSMRCGESKRRRWDGDHSSCKREQAIFLTSTRKQNRAKLHGRHQFRKTPSEIAVRVVLHHLHLNK